MYGWISCLSCVPCNETEGSPHEPSHSRHNGIMPAVLYCDMMAGCLVSLPPTGTVLCFYCSSGRERFFSTIISDRRTDSTHAFIIRLFRQIVIFYCEGYPHQSIVWLSFVLDVKLFHGNGPPTVYYCFPRSHLH